MLSAVFVVALAAILDIPYYIYPSQKCYNCTFEKLVLTPHSTF